MLSLWELLRLDSTLTSLTELLWRVPEASAAVPLDSLNNYARLSIFSLSLKQSEFTEH